MLLTRKFTFFLLGGFLFLIFPQIISAQEAQKKATLNDLSFFAKTTSNWQIVNGVTASLEKEKAFNSSPGTGVLVNLPDDKNEGNIFTKLEHGDIDLDLEFMMAKGSNSGIYLQGRYEIQLLDSWGKKHPAYYDCGGIYQRWDESKPEGDQGYQGYAPRSNACRAPGLWQRLQISFQAPRFDQMGKKTANARILSIKLNGVTIHANVELTGPTRGPELKGEATKGPLMIQGDHGPVAFRNIKYQLFEPRQMAFTDMKYEMYSGFFRELPNLSKLTPTTSGAMTEFTHEVATNNEKLLLYITGSLDIPTEGMYHWEMDAYGSSQLTIDGQVVVPFGWRVQKGKGKLTKGKHKIEIHYNKADSWMPNGLGVFLEGPDLRKTALHTLSSLPLGNPTNPIPLHTSLSPQVRRCFIDYRDGKERKRIVHAISVGLPEGTNFTFDPDNGVWVQSWRGDFLDATPMWNSRGDGSARPKGDVQTLGSGPNMGLVLTEGAAWPKDVSPSLGYKFLGYELDQEGIPSFLYKIGSAKISDKITGNKMGTAVQRKVSVEGNLPSGLQFRIASGNQIEELGNDLYRIDQRYYLQLPKKQKASVRFVGGKQELLIPISNSGISYSLIW